MGLLFYCLGAQKFTKIKVETDKRSLYVLRQSVTTCVPVLAPADKTADKGAAEPFLFSIYGVFATF